MNAAPKSPRKTVAAVAAAIAARVANPSKLLVDPATPGLAGVLVLFRPPHERPTVNALRDAFEAALTRATPADPALLAAHIKGSDTFLASNPDEVTPVARLGLAVRAARTDTSEWVHNGTKDGHSRWTYCDSHVQREGGARILGDADACAECQPDGTLTIDPGVPTDIADTLRSAYDAAGGVIEPARIKQLVALHFAKCGGRAITDDCYLIPETTTVNVGVLAGLVDLGGWGTTVAVADPERIAALSSPVTKSIEEQIADVIAEAGAFIDRAKAAADPKSEDMMRSTVGETVAEKLDAALKAASLWSDRLNLAALDMQAKAVEALKATVEDEDRKAQAAIDARRAARKAAKAAKDAAPDLKTIDEEQARDERRAAKGGAQ